MSYCYLTDENINKTRSVYLHKFIRYKSIYVNAQTIARCLQYTRCNSSRTTAADNI